MKLASYAHEGRASFGIVTDAGIVDVPSRRSGLSDLKSALAAPGGLGALGSLAGEKPDVALAAVTFLPVIPNAGKVLCIGLNYRAHAGEVNKPTGDHPVVFSRFNDAQVGAGQPVVRARVSTKFDYEGEMALIIGRRARHLAEADALSIIAGYTAFMDGSVRDWQGHTSQYTPGKNFYHSGAMGPWMVTADEIADPASVSVKTRLNGETVQDGTTADLIFTIPKLIAYITTFTELNPGDVIATGTPSGVGQARRPPLYLKGGDMLEVEVGGIGILRNPIVDEA